MIVVKVELWPYGSQEGAREIGRAQIVNDGSGSRDIGHYRFSFDPMTDKEHRGVVRDHRRSSGVWYLLWRALTEAINA